MRKSPDSSCACYVKKEEEEIINKFNRGWHAHVRVKQQLLIMRMRLLLTQSLSGVV